MLVLRRQRANTEQHCCMGWDESLRVHSSNQLLPHPWSSPVSNYMILNLRLYKAFPVERAHLLILRECQLHVECSEAGRR